MFCLTIISFTVSAYTYPKSIREREEGEGFNMDDLIRNLHFAIPIIIIIMIPIIVFSIMFLISYDRVINILSPGEKIIFRDRYLFATNRRFIRCFSIFKFEFLEYSKITSITPEKISIARIVGRIIFISLGVLLLIIGTIAYIGPEFSTGTTLYRLKGDLSTSIVSWVFGIITIISGFLINSNYLQIHSSNFNKFDQAKWRFHIKGKKVEKLFNIIKKAQESPNSFN